MARGPPVTPDTGREPAEAGFQRVPEPLPGGVLPHLPQILRGELVPGQQDGWGGAALGEPGGARARVGLARQYPADGAAGYWRATGGWRAAGAAGAALAVRG